jgi:hypothetical protein
MNNHQRNYLLHSFQVLALSETFGRADQPTILEPHQGFSTWKTERSGTDKGGGGLAILYKDTLPAHQWNPSVPAHLQYVMNERQWLLLDNQKERCAILHVYIACQTTRNENFLQWNEDLFWMITQEAIKLRSQGFVVLALGDFNSRVGAIPGLEGNTPDTNRNTPLFMNFIREVNLVIINTLPISKGLFTRFMDSSGRPGTRSLLDYGLIDGEHTDTVTTFIIDEEARHAAGTDHALLECDLVFGPRPKVNWSFQAPLSYNITGVTDFSTFQNNLDSLASSIRLDKFASLSTEEMLPHVSETLNQSAVKSFGLKMSNRKRGNKLPRSAIALIRTKNAVAREYRASLISGSPSSTEHLLKTLNEMKALVKDSLINLKLSRRNRLRSKLLHADPTRRRFWRFLRNQMSSAGSISAIYDKDGKMVFDQHETEEAILHHFGKSFQGKRHPVHTPTTSPDQIDTAKAEIDLILLQNPTPLPAAQFESEVCTPYTFLELDHLLSKLPAGKACGYDKISNEMLRHSSFIFKQYLLIFLNKIIEDGLVPPDLNKGKCMLIFKVSSKFLKNSN